MVKMETTFYEDPSFRPRRNLTLDLNHAPKRSKLAGLNGVTPGLSSLDGLKMPNTPDLDKLVRANGDLPALAVTPTTTERVLADAKNMTEEEESFVKGFEDALKNVVHNSDSSSQGDMLSVGNSGLNYLSLDSFQPGKGFFSSSMVVVKDEPQTVPNISSSSPPMPVDMEAQEQLKLERKRQRNRLAASKCRRKKLERISKLEQKVQSLKSENNELTVIVKKMKDQVCELKRQVLEHNNSGCQILPMSQSLA